MIDELKLREVFTDASITIDSGSIRDSDGSDIKCDYRLKLVRQGTAVYLPLYDTTV